MATKPVSDSDLLTLPELQIYTFYVFFRVARPRPVLLCDVMQHAGKQTNLYSPATFSSLGTNKNKSNNSDFILF